MNRINLCDIALHGYVGGPSILIIQPPTNPCHISLSSPIQLVFVGFGHTVTAEESKKAAYDEEYGDVTEHQWLEIEFSSMTTKMSYTFGTEEVEEWISMEEERGLLFEDFPYLFDC